jgi:hypothetical protein
MCESSNRRMQHIYVPSLQLDSRSVYSIDVNDLARRCLLLVLVGSVFCTVSYTDKATVNHSPDINLTNTI